MNRKEAAILRSAKRTSQQRRAHASMMGNARAKKLTPEQRKAISAKAIKARWDKYRVIHSNNLK